MDILILTLLLYGIFLFFKDRRAGKLALGLVLLVMIYGISDIAGLRTIHQLMDWIAPFFIILLAVVFQPEIRDGLERLGDKPFGLLLHNRDQADTARVISEVVDAACSIAQTNKDGALIVIDPLLRLRQGIRRHLHRNTAYRKRHHRTEAAGLRYRGHHRRNARSARNR